MILMGLAYQTTITLCFLDSERETIGMRLGKVQKLIKYSGTWRTSGVRCITQKKNITEQEKTVSIKKNMQ